MPTYTGTAGDDSMVGSTGADTLTGLNGNDTYTVNHLGDVIVETNVTGSGIDTIRTSVLDSLATYSLETWLYVENLTYTGTLAAQLKGNGLSNVIAANSATVVNDTLYGNAGNDTLYGYGGADLLVGGTGNDVMDGGTGVDTMIGGTGNDRYAVDSASDRVYEYASGGFDTIVSAVARDLRVSWATQVEGLSYTGSAATTLHGNALGNLITSASASNETLYGYAGDDTLDGGSGTDALVGGLGNDFYFTSSTDGVTELAGEGIDTLIGLKLDLSVAAFASTVENLFYTGTSSVSLLGNGLANVISGGSGNDTVSGGEGKDTLIGGSGVDSLVGGNGDDIFYGGGNPDYVWLPNRKLVPDSVADKLVGGAGNDRYLIDSTLDTVSEASTGGTLDVVISAIDNSLSRYAYVEALVLQRDSSAWFAQGTTGNNILVGNEGDSYLVGGAGNDTLSGWAEVANTLAPQSDVIDAGDGNDVLLAVDFGNYYSNAREVSMFGGAGNDLYIIGTGIDTYGSQDSGGTDTAVLVNSGSIDNLEGVENVVLYGSDPATDASVRAAIGTVYAAVNFGAAYTGSIGTAYNATGNALANKMLGNSLDNHLIGGAGNDSLTGYGGHDTLEGGTGVDSLVGGLGNDWYYLDTGDVAIESAGQGFDMLASLTIANFTGYANFEGLQYLGNTAVNLNRGSTNVTNDFLGGGNGNDTVLGFGGNDTLSGGEGADSVNGGVGNDSLSGNGGNDSVLGGADNDTLDGGDGADNLQGEAGDDRLLGGAGNDVIDAGGNWDSVDAGDGNDTAVGGDGKDTLHGNAGDDVLAGQSNEDSLVGGAGMDELRGGAALPANGATTSSYGDHLFGDEDRGTGGGETDLFIFDTVLAENGVSETFTGSGAFEFINGATIGDFETAVDAFLVAKEFVGDGDNLLEGAVTTTSAGASFSASAEIVFMRANVVDTFAYGRTSFFDDIDAAAVDAVVGNASASMAVNTTKLFVLDDGTNSAVFLFQSNNGDSVVTLDELYLLSVVTGQSAMTGSDFLLF